MRLGWPELVIILVVALLIFGGSRLAGIGRSAGRAIKEFKEETAELKGGTSTVSPPEPSVEADGQADGFSSQPERKPDPEA